MTLSTGGRRSGMGLYREPEESRMQEGGTPEGAGHVEEPPASSRGLSIRRHTRSLVCVGVVIGLLALGFGLVSGNTSSEAWAAATRMTARVSAVFFLAAFSASALARLWRSGATAVLLRERRGVGLGFCAAHLVHLVAVIGLGFSGEPPGPVALIGGTVAYVWLLAMAFTSTDRALQRLGVRRWRLLHGAGMYYLWGIFALGYLGKVVREDVGAEHALLFTLMVYAMLLRIYQRLHSSR